MVKYHSERWLEQEIRRIHHEGSITPALAGTKNSSMGPPRRINPTTRTYRERWALTEFHTSLTQASCTCCRSGRTGTGSDTP